MRRRPAALPAVREEPCPAACWRAACASERARYSLVACVAVLTYGNSLHGEFVHDDIPAIVTNGDVTGANPLHDVLWNDFWGTPMSAVSSHKSYRPLTTLTFRVNYAVSGLSRWSWHATNLALHVTCCALVLRVAERVARLRRTFASLAALLFAVHPIHAEAVSGVVGRADVLACVFYLASLLAYHGSRGGPRLARSVVCAALSMLAKETGLTALLVNVCLDVYRSWTTTCRSPPAPRSQWWVGGARGRVCRVLAAFLALAALRLALLQGSLPRFSPQDNPPSFHPSTCVRLLTFSYLAALNLWLLLCPWSLSHDWQMGSVPLVASPLDPRNLLTGAAFLVLAALLARVLMDFEQQRRAPAGCGLLLLVLPFLPASNLVVTVGFVIAERVLYIPSAGLVILSSYGVQLAWQRRRARTLLLLGALALVAGGAARTQLRNQEWSTRESLLRADLKTLPHNAKLHYNFGNFLKDIELRDAAIEHYQEALRLWPSYASAHNNLGTLVTTERARWHFLQALRYNRDHVNAHYNLAKLYRKQNLVSESLKMLERCVALEPRFVQAHMELLLLKPDTEKRAVFQKLLEIDPYSWEHHLYYGYWLKDNGLKLESLRYFNEAMRLTFNRAPDKSRGDLLTLRAACLLLRSLGQWARVLQLVSRWHTYLGGPRNVLGASNLFLRERRLRTELAHRATLYARRQLAAGTVKSTCLHHSHLEVSSEPYHTQIKNLVELDTNIKENIVIIENTGNSKATSRTEADYRRNVCQNSVYLDRNKGSSIQIVYKPLHNKSDTARKSQSCPLHKENAIKRKEDYVPFISDQFIIIY